MRNYRFSQTLNTGIAITQHCDRISSQVVRSDADFAYPSIGGSIFLVSLDDQLYGLTCKHVLGSDFTYGVCVRGERNTAASYLPVDRVVGFSIRARIVGENDYDIADLAIVKFASGVAIQDAYLWRPETICNSKRRNALFTSGYLLPQACVDYDRKEIPEQLALIELVDAGHYPADLTLRKSIGSVAGSQITSANGLSGSPVFNRDQQALCGMVVRGGVQGSDITLHYLEVFDINEALTSYHLGKRIAYQRLG